MNELIKLIKDTPNENMGNSWLGWVQLRKSEASEASRVLFCLHILTIESINMVCVEV